MGEGGCCSGCLATILGIVGVIFAFAWGIVKFICELFVDIIVWVFKKIFGLFAWCGEQIRDFYLYINQGCLNVVGIPVWGVILILIAIALAIGLIYLVVDKIAYWRLKLSVKKYTDKARLYEQNKQYWDAVKEWRNAYEMISRQKGTAPEDERIDKLLKELHVEGDAVLHLALEDDTKSFVQNAENLQKEKRFKEAAAEWKKAYKLANERRVGFYNGMGVGNFITYLCCGYDTSLLNAYKENVREFVHRAKKYESASQFKESAAEWNKALQFMQTKTTDFFKQDEIKELLEWLNDKYEKDLLNDVNLVVKPMISKAKKALSQNDYLSSAKLYQKAAETYRCYTPSLSLITSEAEKCESKYKGYVAKHVENQVKALKELDW